MMFNANSTTAGLDTTPLHARYFADAARFQEVQILRHARIAEDTYRLSLRAPEIAARILPGQFVMLRIAGCQDPLLGRPFALYEIQDDFAGSPLLLEIVYLVTGKMTKALSRLLPGQALEVWGPLGNGFPDPADNCDQLILVAGGIGQTPFLAVGRQALGDRGYGGAPARRRVDEVVLCYGARSAEYFAGLDDFASAGLRMRLATDNGSRGTRGFATALLEQVLAESGPGSVTPRRQVYCCGPEPMMARVAEISAKAGVACYVSLETPMACGIGACYTCVAPLFDAPLFDTPQPSGEAPASGHMASGNREWDYKRTCVEGPVFDARRVCWHP